MTLPSVNVATRIFQLELDAATFAADWKHCGQIANHLASLAGIGRADSDRYSNLLSTVLNELFELAFCHHADVGHLKCALLRNGPSDRIELTIPVDDSARTFYQSTVATAQSARASDLYQRYLDEGTSSDHAAGILELVNDYGASVSLEEGSGDLQLAVDVQLETGDPRTQPKTRQGIPQATPSA